MSRPSGIVYYDSLLSNKRVHLPLEEVKVKVLIVDGEFSRATAFLLI